MRRKHTPAINDSTDNTYYQKNKKAIIEKVRRVNQEESIFFIGRTKSDVNNLYKTILIVDYSKINITECVDINISNQIAQQNFPVLLCNKPIFLLDNAIDEKKLGRYTTNYYYNDVTYNIVRFNSWKRNNTYGKNEDGQNKKDLLTVEELQIFALANDILGKARAEYKKQTHTQAEIVQTTGLSNLSIFNGSNTNQNKIENVNNVKVKNTPSMSSF